MNSKTPDLKLRYAIGLGDIIACTLHSRTFSWLTRLITGKDKPCGECSVRRNAWNLLFPIKVWKLFYNSKLEFIHDLAADFRGHGYKVTIHEESETISLSKFDKVEDNSDISIEHEKMKKEIENQIKDNIKNYHLMDEKYQQANDMIIKTQYFKKN
jgi:hypothetical protein